MSTDWTGLHSVLLPLLIKKVQVSRSTDPLINWNPIQNKFPEPFFATSNKRNAFFFDFILFRYFTWYFGANAVMRGVH